MKFKKEIKIGVIVTLIILLFLWGYNFLKGRNLFSSYNYYYAVFQDIGGLQKSSPVNVSGYSVGIVSDIAFSSENMDRLIVELGIKKDFHVPDNSTVTIASDLIGTKSVNIMLGDSRRIAEKGDTLPSSVSGDLISSITENLAPIAEKAGNLIVTIDSVLNILRSTFDDNTQADIKNIISELENLVAAERQKVSRILTNFEAVSSNLSKSNEDISNMLSNLSMFSDSLATSEVKLVIANANRSMMQLDALLTGINEGEGTLGQLTRNDSVYVYLQRSLEDLDKLLIDLRENPKNYVHFSLFGRKNK